MTRPRASTRALGPPIRISRTLLSISADSYTDQYTFDLAGNRLTKSHAAGGQTLVSAYQYNVNDQLTLETGTIGSTQTYQTVYGYDPNGSESSVARTGASPETDSY